MNVKSPRSLSRKHIRFIKTLEKQGFLAYRFVMANLIKEMRSMILDDKTKKLKKSDDGLGSGWSGEIPKINFDLTGTMNKVINKHMQALRWVLLGDYAGPDARKAAKALGLMDKVTPGLMQSAYLNSLDTHEQIYYQSTNKEPPKVPEYLLEGSLEQIVDRTNRYLESSLTEIRNNLLNTLERLQASKNLENSVKVHKKATKAIDENPDLDPDKAVDDAVKDIDVKPAKTRVTKELNETVKNHQNKWKTSVRTELGLSSAAASHQAMTEIYATKEDEVRVVWVTSRQENVCQFCRTASMHPNGEFKYYKLSDLHPSGANIGRKRKDWVLAIPPSTHPNCYDNQTEVLTDEGWKPFPEVTGDEKFLSVELGSGDAEWVNAVEKIEYDYKGEMDYFHHKYADFCTTPDHNHVVKFQVNPKGRKQAGFWQIEQGTSLPNNGYSFLATIPNWQGKPQETLQIGDLSVNSLDFCDFLGIYLSEGCIVQINKDTGQWRISIAQQKYHVEMSEVMRNVFGKRANCRPNNNVIDVYTKNKELINMLHDLGHSYQKSIPKFIKEYDKEHLERLLYWYAMGDGSMRLAKSLSGYKQTQETEVFTSSPQLMADLSELMLKIGRRPSFTIQTPKEIQHKNGLYKSKHLLYRIRMCHKGTYSSARIKREKIPYNDKVYCVNLEKNHTLVVRRNGRVVISGNCNCFLVYVPSGFKVTPDGELVPE